MPSHLLFLLSVLAFFSTHFWPSLLLWFRPSQSTLGPFQPPPCGFGLNVANVKSTCVHRQIGPRTVQNSTIRPHLHTRLDGQRSQKDFHSLFHHLWCGLFVDWWWCHRFSALLSCVTRYCITRKFTPTRHQEYTQAYEQVQILLQKQPQSKQLLVSICSFFIYSPSMTFLRLVPLAHSPS